MKKLRQLKKMLSDAHTEIRSSKKKTLPAFGVEMYLLNCIIQCNAALNEKVETKNDGTQ
jgi:hypothetical protein